MEKYIKKSALVEWIKKEDKDIQPNKDWHFDEYTEGYVDALAKILSFIDTLEVKDLGNAEVDLVKDIRYADKEVDLEKELDRYTDSAEFEYNVIRDSYFLVAKHFFELGMQVNNKSQKGENV